MVMMMFVFRTAAGFLIFTMIMFFMIVMVMMMLMMFIFVMVLMCMTYGHNHRIRFFFRCKSTDFFFNTLSFIMIALILE